MSIFISYRRDFGDNHVAGRIYEWLERSFGKERVFKDVDSISLGIDFRRSLSEVLARCDVLLAVIGERWVDATNESGERRLDQETDYVRLEIEAALRRDIRVIPLLIDRTAPPKQKDLPESLKDLSYRQGMHVRPDPDFHWDMERLIRALEQVIGPRQGSSASRGLGADPPEQSSATRTLAGHTRGVDPLAPVTRIPVEPPLTKVPSAPAVPISIEPAAPPSPRSEGPGGRAHGADVAPADHHPPAAPSPPPAPSPTADTPRARPPVVDVDRLKQDRPAAAAPLSSESPTADIPPGRAPVVEVDRPDHDWPAAAVPPSSPLPQTRSEVVPSTAIRRLRAVGIFFLRALVALSMSGALVIAEVLLAVLGSLVYGESIQMSTRDFLGFGAKGAGQEILYPAIIWLLRIGLPAFVGIILFRLSRRQRWIWALSLGPALFGGSLAFHLEDENPFASTIFRAGLGLGLPATFYLATRRAFTMSLRVSDWWPKSAHSPARETTEGEGLVLDGARWDAARSPELQSASPLPTHSATEMVPSIAMSQPRTALTVFLPGLVAFSLFTLLAYAEGSIGLLGAFVYSVPIVESTRDFFGYEPHGIGPDFVYPITIWLLRIGLPVVIAVIAVRRSLHRRIRLLLVVPPLVAGLLVGLLDDKFIELDVFYAGVGAGIPVTLYLAIRSARSMRNRLEWRPTIAVVAVSDPDPARSTRPPLSSSPLASSESEIRPPTPIRHLRAIRNFAVSAYVALALFLLLVVAEGLLGLLGTGLHIVFMKTPSRVLYGVPWLGPDHDALFYAVPTLLLFVGLPIVLAIMFYCQRWQQRWIWSLALVPALVGGPILALIFHDAFMSFFAGLGMGIPAALYLAIRAGISTGRTLSGRRIGQPAAIAVG
jgi:hypothetical protein